MSDVAVSVEGLSKRYRIAHQRDPYGRLTESLSAALRAPVDLMRGKRRETTEWIWALRDVSFELRQGDVVGVIGRNGAGKTTLLKVLSRITEPSAGSATLRGRVGSLLEVGTGFHPELTGRENVFMSGAVLGMRRAEISRKFDEIVEFAGIEQFLDTPVKRYSSGMQVRLGFAVAAHLETEILIVDEVLAVGDAEFQRKCLSKMGDVSHEGRTILFVSHNMAAIESLCTTAMLLDRGETVASGSVRAITDAYDERVRATAGSEISQRTDRQGDGKVKIMNVETDMRTGEESWIRLRYAGPRPLSNVEIGLAVRTDRGEPVALLGNSLTGQVFPLLPPAGVLVCRLPRGSLAPGTYVTNVYCTVNGVIADWVMDAARFDVQEGDFFGTGKLPPPGYGHVLVEHEWTAAAD